MTQPHNIDREAVLERLRALDFAGHYDEARFQYIADDILALSRPMEAVAALSPRPVDDTGGGFSSVNPAGPEAAALIERLAAERDEARAENARWLLRMEAIREASGVGVLPMLSELPDAIAAKMADHIGDADHMIAPLPELSGNPGGLSDHPPECVCTKIPPYDGHSGVVAHYSGPPPIWINAACPVHGHKAAAPAGHDLREKVAEAINRAMIDGQGDQDIIRLATDDILALPEIAALQAGEGR